MRECVEVEVAGIFFADVLDQWTELTGWADSVRATPEPGLVAPVYPSHGADALEHQGKEYSGWPRYERPWARARAGVAIP